MSKNLAKKLIAWMLAAGMLLTSVPEVGWAAERYPEAEADQAEMELTEELLDYIGGFDVVCRVFIGRPIAVGKHAVCLHCHVGRNKHMIDAAISIIIGLEGVECAILGEADAGSIVRVLQQA